jgi:dipeptide transport system ATP-binding protein
VNAKHAIAGDSLSKCFITKDIFGNVTETYWALHGVSFEVFKGETLGILGESGSGKSTLAKILVGAEEPTEGSLLIDNKDVTELSEDKRKHRNRRVRMVYQNTLGSLNPSLSLGEILLEPLINMTKLDYSERIERLKQVLDLVGLKWEYINRLPHTFSAGERQRIAIARALVLDPVCIIADEPLSSLETSAQSQIINLILELQKNLGISFIIITHNLDVIRHMCDKLLVLCRGRTVEYGATMDIISTPLHPYTQNFLDISSNPQSNGELAGKDAQMNACVYSDRCSLCEERCKVESPVIRQVTGRQVACHLVQATDDKDRVTE